MTPGEWHAALTRYAVEAGADPERARERMAQAAQVVVSEIDAASMHGRGCTCGETDEEEVDGG